MWRRAVRVALQIVSTSSSASPSVSKIVEKGLEQARTVLKAQANLSRLEGLERGLASVVEVQS